MDRAGTLVCATPVSLGHRLLVKAHQHPVPGLLLVRLFGGGEELLEGGRELLGLRRGEPDMPQQQLRITGGGYQQVSDPAELAAQVTADLQLHNGDLHLRLKHHPQPIPDLPGWSPIGSPGSPWRRR